MQKLKSNLTCSYCSKIYKDPVELPCGDLICKEHLNDNEVVQKNKIKCQECKQEFEVKGIEFNLSKAIQKQIDNKLYLNDDEIALKQKIEESIKVFYQMYDTFTLNKTKLDLDCHEHFQELRFQLDIHREKLKEKIDEIYMEMIEKTKEHEASYLKKLNEKLTVSIVSFKIKSIDEALREVEEKFRDPNLLIKNIEEMNQTHEKALEIIQSKLNKIAQLKEDSKLSNQFKPNLIFDKSSFGQLDFNLYSSVDPFKSQILTGQQQPLELIKLCEFDSIDRFTLLYRGSRDGFRAEDFHSKCDGKGNTLTILKANGFVFGGFTSASWESCDTGKNKSDSNAFLFSLTNKDNKPCKMKIQPFNYAIICHSKRGPAFGIVCIDDICIADNANTNTNSFSSLGHSFKHPQYAENTNEAHSFLASSDHFQLSEIEVYQKE